MTRRVDIEAFFKSPAYAVVGVSADRKKFGNAVFRTMKEKGFTVYPVHPASETVEGEKCYHSVAELPPAVESIVTVVPPDVTESVVRSGVTGSVRHIWMQPGSVSQRAVEAARAAGATVVEGECILMFLEPVESIHALHRWLKKLLGKYPTA
jgi:predicted CoA-binding protein